MSEIYLNKDCKTKIHLFDLKKQAIPLCHEIIEKNGIVVIDNLVWNYDKKLVQKNLEHNCRIFDGEFKTISPLPEVMTELKLIQNQIAILVKEIFSAYSYERNGHGIGYRPMVTGPEWMHFDTKPVDKMALTCYLNLDNLPRIYKISHTFPWLIKNERKAMTKLKKAESFYPVTIRANTIKNKGVINNRTPKHTILFDPGTIWFFNPHMVSHEVVFGRGAMGQSWWVLNSKCKTQTELMEKL